MKRNSHGFVNQFLVCLLVALFGGGSIGVGTVWMRQQITRTAKINRELEARLLEIDRHLAEINVSVEAAQTHDELRRRNVEWNLGLVPATDAQVTHVELTTAQMAQRMAVRANRELFNQVEAPATMKIALGR